MNIGSIKKRQKHIWVANTALAIAYLASQISGGLLQGSTQNLANISADPFNGAIMPIAFVPDWSKGDYVENRSTLSVGDVGSRDFVPLPDYNDIVSDFLSNFTYLTVFAGSYVDADREEGDGSHLGVDIRAPIDTPIFAIANGVVVETTDSSSSTHVVIRHDDVSYRGTVEDYYSGYLHMKEIDVSLGQKVSKGEQIGTVGMTGITTTPHLHLQIDKEDAPFHPYWPFTYSEALAAGYDFFSAVNAGFHVDRVLEYSVDPMDFIENAKASSSTQSSAREVATTEQVIPTSSSTAVDNRDIEAEVQKQAELLAAQEREKAQTTALQDEEKIYYADTGNGLVAMKESEYQAHKKQKSEERETQESSVPRYEEVKNTNIFPDVSIAHKHYDSIKYFVDQGIISGYADGNFGPDNTLTRAEMLAIILKALDIDNSEDILYDVFRDIPREHWVNPLVTTAVDLEIITTTRDRFEIDRAVTKAEFLAIMMVAAGEEDMTLYRSLLDVDKDDWYAPFAQANYAYKLFDDYDSRRFNPDYSVKRGEVTQAMYRYLNEKGGIVL